MCARGLQLPGPQWHGLLQPVLSSHQTQAELSLWPSLLFGQAFIIPIPGVPHPNRTRHFFRHPTHFRSGGSPG